MHPGCGSSLVLGGSHFVYSEMGDQVARHVVFSIVRQSLCKGITGRYAVSVKSSLYAGQWVSKL
jgi:hypothetical protein